MHSVRRRATSERDLLNAEPPEGEHEAGGGATLERGATRPGGVAIEGGTSVDDVDGPIKVKHIKSVIRFYTFLLL